MIFLGINLLFLSITFLWSQLKLWSTSQQCLAISILITIAIPDAVKDLEKEEADMIHAKSKPYTSELLTS